MRDQTRQHRERGKQELYFKIIANKTQENMQQSKPLNVYDLNVFPTVPFLNVISITIKSPKCQLQMVIINFLSCTLHLADLLLGV